MSVTFVACSVVGGGLVVVVATTGPVVAVSVPSVIALTVYEYDWPLVSPVSPKEVVAGLPTRVPFRYTR